MELRGCSQVHFIYVIRGAEVTKMQNISRGKSVLKFKDIEEIYDSDGCQESLPSHPPKVDRSLAIPGDGDTSKPKVKTECVEEEESEFEFGRMTLKQLKRESKKRKAPKLVKLATVKQEACDLSCEEEELDLKETLFSWKRKVKKSKSKTNKTSNCGSPLSVDDCFRCISEDDTPSSLAAVDISSETPQIEEENPDVNPIQPQAISFALIGDNQNSSRELTGTVECCSSDEALESDLGDPQRGCLNQFSLDDAVQLESVDTSNCVFSQISYDVSEHMGDYPTVSNISSYEDIAMTEGLVTTDEPLVHCCSEIPIEEEMTNPVMCDYHPPSFESEAATGDENLVTSLDEVKSVVDAKEVSAAGVTSTELQASIYQNGDSEDVGRRSCSMDVSSEQDNKVSVSTNCVASLPSTTFMVEDKHSSADDFIADAMMPHPPERLFSTRKIISPICQERLRKAMKCDEQQDDVEIHSHKKVLFEKSGDSSSTSSPGVKRARTTFSSESPETCKAVDVQAKGRNRLRKAKYGTRASQKPQNVGSVCSSVQMCSQNAVAFSKQQIHDIERIATKLMTGLHSMKSIVVDALQHESRTGTKFRYNTDQVRLAVENVGKVEETAQRWLSMMSRDCDRFCKIMSLAEADAPSPEKSKGETSPDAKTVPKERKIMFADEVGGSLCNVKVFKNFETDMDIDTPATC
ncbi:hypothetical protein vseg_001541 [Gypsophila vaccaria]